MFQRFRWQIFALACLVLAVSVLLPAPAELGQEGLRCLGIFTACCLLWVTGVLPLAVTSLAVLALLPLLGVLPADRAFALFGNRAVFFILGALVLAASMISTGFSTRLALLMVTRFGRNSRVFLLGVLLSSAFLSFWTPAPAVAAMMFPVILQVVHALKLPPIRSTYGKALFLALAWGSAIGGITTLLGGARNPLAIAILYQTTGETIGFFEWMEVALPLSLTLLAVTAVILDRLAANDRVDITPCREILAERLKEVGPLSLAEKRLAWIGLITILTWMFLGQRIGLAQISLLSAVLLFVFRVTDWAAVEENVNWGIIIMYGGAVALGAALVESGAAHWLAAQLVAHALLPPVIIMLVLATVTILLTEGISNSAAVAVVLPIALSLAQLTGIPGGKMTMFAVALPAGLAFCLPMGSPPNAITYSAGYYKLRDILILGLVLKAIGLAIFAALMIWVWPHMGLALD